MTTAASAANLHRMKTLLSWSTGKDSAWALHLLRQDPEIELAGLFSTLNEAFDRVAMHGVRRALLEAQAKAAGLPLEVIPIPWPCANGDYEQRMGAFVARAKAAGVEAIAFGDLFLEDIRAYRETMLDGTGIRPIFPVWGIPTDRLAQEMIGGGLEAIIACIDPRKLDESFAGRRFDAALLADLPESIDPCGENGEFHTCVTGGPMFDGKVAVTAGEIATRDGFVFADIIPVMDEAA